MTSSGIKRGLAATAISALAITGIPALASPASAEPIIEDAMYAGTDGTVTPGPPVVQASVEAGDLSLLNPDEAAAPITSAPYTLVAASNDDVQSVQFQYSGDAGVTWTNIGGRASRTNGAFVRIWDAPLTGLVRAVPYNPDNDAFPAAAPTQNVVKSLPENADTAKITGPTNVGVWNEKPLAAADGNLYMGVSGTTSLSDTAASGADDGYSVIVDARTSDAVGSSTTVDLDPATPGTFSGSLDITGYDFKPGGPDEIVVGAEPEDTAAPGARVNVEDAAVKTLYLQQLGTVTATAATPVLQAGKTTTVTIAVTDTTGQPIAGAKVYQQSGSTGTPIAGRTNAQGQLTVSSVSPGTYTYYVNAPATSADNSPTTYDAGLQDKNGSVVVSNYTPQLDEVRVFSKYGPNFDLDEVDPVAPIVPEFILQALDQNDQALGNQTLFYTWKVVPFDTSVATQTSAEQGPVTSNATTGRASIEFPDASDFASGTLPSGTYTLQVYKKALGGVGAFTAAPQTFKAGEALTVFTPADAQAAIGGEVTIEGSLELEDGTAIGSIDRDGTDKYFPDVDIDRVANLSYAPGLEDDPTTAIVETNPGDSRLAALVDQDSTVVNINAGGTTGAVKFNAAGVANVKVKDATPETFEEIDATLRVDVTGDADSGASAALPLAPTADATDVEIDFLTSVVASAVTSTHSDTIAGPAAPGRPETFTFTVRNASGKTLSGKTVNVTVGGGGFITPNLTPAGAPVLTPAQQNGVYVNSGTTATVTTDGNGQATVTVAIEKNAGFDDDFKHTVTVSATADAATVSDSKVFVAQDAVDVQDVQIVPDEDNTAGDPDAQVGFETVDYDVFAHDQFGNLSLEDFTADDSNPRSDIEYNNGTFVLTPAVVVGGVIVTPAVLANGTQNELSPPALTASATSATTQVITVNATDNAGALPSATVTDETDPINWYVIDFAASTFTLGQQGPEVVPTGTRVTEVLHAEDQMGRTITGLDVDFLRSGPTDSDSDNNGFDRTDVNGDAYYDFVGGSNGTAEISAIVSNDVTANELRVATANDTVSFTGGPIVPNGPKNDIVAKTKGRNNGGKADKVTIKVAVESPGAIRDADGAVVKLFKVKGNKTGNKRTLVGKKTLDGRKVTFKVKDRNGAKKTRYFAVIKGTKLTKKGRSNNRGLR